MTVLYDEENLFLNKRRYKRGIFAVAACFVLTVIFNIVLFILLNDENALVVRITVTAVDILSFWFVFALFSLAIMPKYRESKFIEKMLSAKKAEISGKIVTLGKLFTIAGGSFIEVVLSDGKTERVIYFEKNRAPHLGAGDELNALVVDGVIFSFGVKNG